MSKAPTNREGLTYAEWLAAADWAPSARTREAWKDCEDPSEYRRTPDVARMSGRSVIHAKFLPPTDTKGARWRVSAPGCKARVYGAHSGSSEAQIVEACVRHYAAEQGWAYRGRPWVGGSHGPCDYFFVLTPA